MEELGCADCALTFQKTNENCAECIAEAESGSVDNPLLLELEKITRDNTELRMKLAECENGGPHNDDQVSESEQSALSALNAISHIREGYLCGRYPSLDVSCFEAFEAIQDVIRDLQYAEMQEQERSCEEIAKENSNGIGH